MQRLYKFILLLFLALFTLLFIYAFASSWIQFKVMAASIRGVLKPAMPDVSAIAKLALQEGLIYALSLLLIIVLLLRKSMAKQQKFTLKNILHTTGWFLLATAVINGVMLVNYTGQAGFAKYAWHMKDAFIFPLAKWTLFLLTWFLLYFTLASRIDKFA